MSGGEKPANAMEPQRSTCAMEIKRGRQQGPRTCDRAAGRGAAAEEQLLDEGQTGCSSKKRQASLGEAHFTPSSRLTNSRNHRQSRLRAVD